MAQIADSTKASLAGGVTGVEPDGADRFLRQRLYSSRQGYSPTLLDVGKGNGTG